MQSRPAPSERLRRQRPRARSGVVTLELILFFPVMVILLIAIIEFGIIYQVNKQVAYASRFGAKLAAEITRNQAAATNLGNYDQASTPNNLKSRIDQYLLNAGLTISSDVQLQHDACTSGQSQEQVSTPCKCGPSAPPLPPGETATAPTDSTAQAYVKVTVCLLLPGNAPNCLSSFGFDLAGRTIQHSTTFRITTRNTPPTAVQSGTPGPFPANFTTTSGSFPLSCGASTSIANPDGTTPGAGPFQISFDGSGSSDLEQPNSGLTFTWTTTSSGGGSVAPSGGTGTTYTPSFAVPPDVSTGNSTSYNYTITLTVTDSCGHTGSCSSALQITTNGSL